MVRVLMPCSPFIDSSTRPRHVNPRTEYTDLGTAASRSWRARGRRNEFHDICSSGAMSWPLFQPSMLLSPWNHSPLPPSTSEDTQYTSKSSFLHDRSSTLPYSTTLRRSYDSVRLPPRRGGNMSKWGLRTCRRFINRHGEPLIVCKSGARS